jgi:hypothetical protein
MVGCPWLKNGLFSFGRREGDRDDLVALPLFTRGFGFVGMV